MVLGATSGIAMAFQRLVAPLGVHFFLVARSEEKLQAVASDLLVRGAKAIDIRTADLNQTEHHPEILEEARARLGVIEMALIAHGVLGEQRAAEADYRKAMDVLQTNLISPVSLITWLANYFEQTGQGTLAVLSSVAGDRGRKSNYVYGASKGALSVFLEGVRNRIDRAGVQVLTIRPGFVSTPMTQHLPPSPLFASPEKIALGIRSAVLQRRDNVYLPGFWRPIMLIIRSVPESIFKKLNL